MQISSNTYFTYDGHQSYLYGLRFAWIEDSPEKIMVSEKKYTQVRNNSQNDFKVVKALHEDSLQFDAEIVSDRVLYDAEVRRIYSKFFDRNQYGELCLPINNEDIYFNCIFTEVEKIEGGYGDAFGVVGFKLKIICDAPWGWTDVKIVTPIIQKESPSDTFGKFYINNRSDSHDYIYPELEVTVPAGSDVTSATRIGNKYCCLGCPLVALCLEGNTSFPTYMTDAEIAAYSTVTGSTVPKKAMIKNITDSPKRGTCFLCKSGYEQNIIMNPATGTIVGTTGDSPAIENKVVMTNKVFVRLVPGVNEFYVENIDCDESNILNLTLKYKEARILV